VYVRNVARGDVLRRAIGVGLAALSGCGVALNTRDADGPRSTLSLTALDLTAEATYFEATPNDSFESAESVDIASAPSAIEGRVEIGGDVDVYDLGPVSIGERVMVTMDSDPALFGAIALFDADGTALLVNDHRNAYLGRTEPFIDVIALYDSSSCYVAVTSTPGFASSGDYTLVAAKQSGAAPPSPRPDTVLLVFSGGANVRIGGRPAIHVPPFDAASISPDYSGQTRRMMGEVVQRVRDDYAAYEVTILSTSEGTTYESGMSRVFFGTYDPALLGVAEGVDEFNATRDQEAVVFTDTFDAFMKLSPTVDQMSQALANVTSHEIGHLLGMVHTADSIGLMDVTASLRELMRDQVFARSPIYSAVFPLGHQDAPQYLLDTIGGDPSLVTPFFVLANKRALKVFDENDLAPARAVMPLSTCALP